MSISTFGTRLYKGVFTIYFAPSYLTCSPSITLSSTSSAIEAPIRWSAEIFTSAAICLYLQAGNKQLNRLFCKLGQFEIKLHFSSSIPIFSFRILVSSPFCSYTICMYSSMISASGSSTSIDALRAPVRLIRRPRSLITKIKMDLSLERNCKTLLTSGTLRLLQEPKVWVK